MASSPNLVFPKMSSNLSPYFQSLICCQCLCEEFEDRVLVEECFLDFDFIAENLPESSGPESDSPEYFSECVKIIAPMLKSVENWVLLSRGTFTFDSLCELTSWTNQPKLFTDLFWMMFENDAVVDISVLLTATAILERALGDVYLMNGPAPCPSMLKDLLVSKPLIHLLGKQVIQVLRLVIGPPISLNIRNVVWHGFPVPGEIPRRCIWFILLLIPSIGHVLRHQGITVTKYRDPVVFPDVMLIHGEETTLLNDEVITTLQTSNFVQWNTEQYWQIVKKLYVDKRYGMCAGLLCYYLEQGLRRVFAVVNHCEHRILTAESSTLFTTFDEILNPVIPGDVDKENELRYTLQDPMMDILFDHLVYPDGPRVRDRLSHGEADWFLFPKDLTDNLISMCVSLTARFVPTDLGQKNKDIERLQTNVQNYQVQFHRISIIKKLIYYLYKQIAEIDDTILINPDLTRRETSTLNHSQTGSQLEDSITVVCRMIVSNWKSDESLKVQSQMVKSAPYQYNRECFTVIGDTLQHKISTLYRDARPPGTAECTQTDGESEILSLLHHVIDECQTTLTQIREFVCLRQQQLQDKQLRSRQRDNLKKFLSSFPSYIVSLKLYGYLVTWQLYHLDDLKALSTKDVTIRIRFWKGVLQCCENIRTCTHTDKNKWTEGLDLINKHVSVIMSNDNKLFKTWDGLKSFLSCEDWDTEIIYLSNL